MRTHTYTVAKGNEVRPEFVGRELTFNRATTVDEALAAGFYENAEALVAAAEAQRLIAIRQKIRDVLGTPEGTVESAVEAANKVKIGAPRAPGSGEGRKASNKPEAVQKRAAAAAGNKMFEKMRSDERFRNQMFKALDNQAEFEAYLAATPAPTEG